MNRLVLALLALMAGLFAQVGPAQARMCGNNETEINAVEGARGAVRGTASQGSTIDAPVARQDRRDREFTRPRPSRPRVLIPSVFFGADRAFE